MKACCALPAMWRSAIRCTGRVLNPSPPSTSLGLVSQLRPDMVKQLKTAGSGKLPKDIQQRKTEHFTRIGQRCFRHHPYHRQGLHGGVLF